MVKLHATRLMRAGEVALWSDGVIVWSGRVGAHVSGIDFDTISMHVDDSAQMTARLSKPAQAEEVLAALAGWWS
jgi:hypothetical protein